MQDTKDENRRTIEEAYESATKTSNLRVEAERRTDADIIIAAGMSEHRLGWALTRLHTEWDGTPAPPQMTAAAIERLAETYHVEASGPHRGMTAEVSPGSDGVIQYVTPLSRAKREADAWHEYELKLRFQRLKTLPEVRASLEVWAASKGMQDVAHIAGAILSWWLSRTCLTCHGVKWRVGAGTGRTTAKACKACSGRGERAIPHGLEGREMLAHMDRARARYVSSLQGKFRHQVPKASS